MSIENNFQFAGRVVRDPELKKTPLGTEHAMYVIAVADVYYDNKGQRQSRSDFFAIHSYGRQAVNDARYLKKGSSIIVQGRVKQWRDTAARKSGIYFDAEYVKYIDNNSRPGAPSAPGVAPMDSEIAEFIAEMERAAHDADIKHE